MYWMGDVPTECDLTKSALHAHDGMDEFVDGRTVMGSWANMCLRCYKLYGVGFGTGRGQHYKKQGDGRWMKIAG